MARRNIKFAESLQTISKMLTSQIETTVNKSRVIVHPITTGQDINLKTAYMTIDQYEKSIAKLAYECADFIDMPQRPTFQEFIDTFSSIDKQKILFAIYDVTYKATFGTQTVYCPCGKNVFKDEIKLGEALYEIFENYDKIFKAIEAIIGKQIVCLHDESKWYAFKTVQGEWHTINFEHANEFAGLGNSKTSFL
jgi:hypothetical protein